MNQYYNPVRTEEGAGCVRELGRILEEMDLEQRRILLLVWNEQVLLHPGLSQVLDADSGFESRTLCFEASNPTVDQLFDTYQATKDFDPEAVVAVGGGSILDVGKSLCCLYHREIPDVDALVFVKECCNQRVDFGFK